jgi:hypothetical protein
MASRGEALEQMSGHHRFPHACVWTGELTEFKRNSESRSLGSALRTHVSAVRMDGLKFARTADRELAPHEATKMLPHKTMGRKIE